MKIKAVKVSVSCVTPAEAIQQYIKSSGFLNGLLLVCNQKLNYGLTFQPIQAGCV